MRQVYLNQGALHSCLGENLAAAVAALQAPPSSPQTLVTTITGDAAKQTDEIPYRPLYSSTLLNDASTLAEIFQQDLMERSFTSVADVVAVAVEQGGMTAERLKKTAIFLGSSSFLVGGEEQQYQHDLKRDAENAMALQDSRYGLMASEIARQFGLQGACYTFNTACTASANALMRAALMIQAGVIDDALIVGTELFNETTLLGFNNLELLTRTAMRPFDQRRNGLQLGEACAAMVISSTPAQHLQRPFMFRGGANLCDAYSISAANPDGSTVWQVMEQALRQAHCSVEDIVAIKAHGTASLMNDDAESSGLQLGFSSMPPLSVLKPYLGHTLGACGLSELILYCEALRQGFVPAVLDGFERDEKLSIELNTELMNPGRGSYMLNYFGFGGNNTSLVIADVDAAHVDTDKTGGVR